MGEYTTGEILALVAPILNRQPEDMKGVIIIGVAPRDEVDVVSTASDAETTIATLEAVIVQEKKRAGF